MPKDVITLQFGGLANYTGTHYWNIQVRTKCFENKQNKS
jgi:Misato Segment II tubulin-like domain